MKDAILEALPRRRFDLTGSGNVELVQKKENICVYIYIYSYTHIREKKNLLADCVPNAL